MVITLQNWLKNSACILLLLFAIRAHTQRAYNSSPLSITGNSLTFLLDSFSHADSSLNEFQYYKPAIFLQDLGNLGSPYKLRYHELPGPDGFQTGWFIPELYFFSPYSAEYYKAKIPYTIAGYITGQRPSNGLDFLQKVSLLHTQN